MAGQMGSKIVLATHNMGKVREFRELFSALPVEISGAAAHGLPAPAETGTSFIENALIKARAAASVVGQDGLWALADDSGLAVDALDGAPGVYSADWAGEDRDYAAAFAKIADGLGGTGKVGGARAAFVCVLALVGPAGEELFAEGRCEGSLAWPPRGEGGFGYDPLFVAEGEGRTFGEMASDEKAQYSHRARAFAALKPRLAAVLP